MTFVKINKENRYCNVMPVTKRDRHYMLWFALVRKLKKKALGRAAPKIKSIFYGKIGPSHYKNELPWYGRLDILW